MDLMISMQVSENYTGKVRLSEQLSYYPDRVKMEMAPYIWKESIQKFMLDENLRQPVQLNQLETMIISYTTA
jgi:hypothetical protein